MKIEIGFQPSCSEAIVSITIPEVKVPEFRKKLLSWLKKDFNKKKIEELMDYFDSGDEIDMDDEERINADKNGGTRVISSSESGGTFYIAIKNIADELGISYNEGWG